MRFMFEIPTPESCVKCKFHTIAYMPEFHRQKSLYAMNVKNSRGKKRIIVK